LRKFLAVFVFLIVVTNFTPTITQSQPTVLQNRNSEFEIFPSSTKILLFQQSTNPTSKPSSPIKSSSNKDEYPILSLLRDSIWQFVGVILVIITIIVSVVIYLLQKNRKSLTYEILSETALLSVAKEVEDKIQILFEGNTVKRVHIILVQISNTGNSSILPSDFLKELTISFNNSAKILSTEISDKNRQSIDTEVSISDTQSQLIIASSLWNSGDAITIKSLVSDFNKDIQVSARIVGIQDIKNNRSGLNPITVWSVATGIFVFTVGLVLSLFSMFNNLMPIIAIISYLLLVSPISYDKKYSRLILSAIKSYGVRRSNL
jgi:hypothetical protein